MGVHVSWIDDSKTAILRQFEGVWTWDEFYASQNEASAMLNSVKHEVKQIFDFSLAHSIPPNALSHLGTSANNMPDNRGISIVVTQSGFYLHMYRILGIVLPNITRRVVVVKTLKEALELIANQTSKA